MPYISFERPYFLSLLLIFIPLYLIYKRNRHNVEPVSLRQQLVFKCLIVLFLALALTKPYTIRSLSRNCYIFALDVSASMSDNDIIQGIKWIDNNLSELKKGDIAGLILFDTEAKAILKPIDYNYKTFKKYLKKLSGKITNENKIWDTDIGAVLKKAGYLYPPDYKKKLVLLSDGNHHWSDLTPQLINLRSGKIRVNVLPLGDVHEKPDVWIDAVYIPHQATLGKPVDIEIKLGASLIKKAELSLFLNKQPIAAGIPVILDDKRSQLVRYPVTINKPGAYIISAKVSAIGDSISENNYGACWMSSYGQSRLLYVSRNPQSPSPLFSHLPQQSSIDIISATQLEETPLAYQNYSHIILDNISAFSLTGAQMRMLKAWVHDLGKGLIVIGGDKSLGPGGYLDTPLEKILPVNMYIEDKNRKSRIAMVLVLDKSESMGYTIGAQSKLEIATDAVIAGLNWFKAQDMIGVAAFDMQARTILPLTGGDKKDEIIQAVKSIEPKGKTNIKPGLALAYNWLKNIKADKKHILLLSDGKSAKTDFSLLLNDIAGAGITVSSVGIGADCDKELLAEISKRGSGRLFLTEDYHQLEKIFFKDLQIATQSFIRDKQTKVVIKNNHPIIKGINPPFPQIMTYVATTVKSDAQNILVSEQGEPILSVGNYGLGKAAVFTANSANWLTWPYFKLFWRQIFNWSASSINQNTRLIPNFVLQADRLNIWLDVLDDSGEFKNKLSLAANIIYPDLSVKKLRLKQTAPGRYEAQAAVKDKGNYLVKILQLEGDKVVESASAGFVAAYSAEAMDKSINYRLLDTTASITAGNVLNIDDNILQIPQREEKAYTALDTVCLLIALFLFFVDIIYRKFSYFFSAR